METTEDTRLQCTCGETISEGARFCEVCGASIGGDNALVPAASAAPSAPAGKHCRCGAGLNSKDEQGFCTQCGRRWTEPGRDHIEIVLSPVFAAVTDIGRRHATNQDDVAVTLEEIDGKPVSIIVVCDGLSSAENSEAASAVACNAAANTLLNAVHAKSTDLQDAMVKAVAAAHKAVCAVPHLPSPDKDPPATTIVAALVENGVATIGWVGDSRAYWFGPQEARVLTHDHSWANEVVDAGIMTEEEAMHSRQAHAITRCLGIEDEDVPGEAPKPSLLPFPIPGEGHLLLCSDGLWNFADSAQELATLLQQLPADADAMTCCRHLVDFALSQGGRDNITVAVLAFGASER